MSSTSTSSSIPISSSTISVHNSMHSSHIYTPGPATNLRTDSWSFPQNEHFNCPFSSLNLNILFTPKRLTHSSISSVIANHIRYNLENKIIHPLTLHHSGSLKTG